MWTSRSYIISMQYYNIEVMNYKFLQPFQRANVTIKNQTTFHPNKHKEKQHMTINIKWCRWPFSPTILRDRMMSCMGSTLGIILAYLQICRVYKVYNCCQWSLAQWHLLPCKSKEEVYVVFKTHQVHV